MLYMFLFFPVGFELFWRKKKKKKKDKTKQHKIILFHIAKEEPLSGTPVRLPAGSGLIFEVDHPVNNTDK